MLSVYSPKHTPQEVYRPSVCEKRKRHCHTHRLCTKACVPRQLQGCIKSPDSSKHILHIGGSGRGVLLAFTAAARIDITAAKARSNWSELHSLELHSLSCILFALNYKKNGLDGAGSTQDEVNPFINKMVSMDAVDIVCLNDALSFDDLLRMSCCSKDWKLKAQTACFSKTRRVFEMVRNAQQHTCTACEQRSKKFPSAVCLECRAHFYVREKDLGKWSVTPDFLVPDMVDDAGNLLFRKQQVKATKERVPPEKVPWLCSALITQLRRRAYWQCLAIWSTQWPDPCAPFVGVSFPPPTHMPSVPLFFQMEHIAGRGLREDRVLTLLRQWSGLAVFPNWVSDFAKRGWTADAIYNRLKLTKVYRKYHGRGGEA